MSVVSAEVDAEYMRRAIRLAMKGRGAVEPNPMVGCVIVKGGRVIGEGYHERFGGPHAEPNALAACTESPEGATAYVTLEPCCHTNKKTPPCVPRLVEAKLARVVVGCTDPNPDVNGKGLTMLREAGIEVARSTVEAEAKQLIAPFVARVCHHRPYVTLKWAQSADGKVAGAGGRRTQISNAAAMRVVHQLRALADAVVVGINTVLNDDPLLTARGEGVMRQPARIVLDRNLRIDPNSRIVRSAAPDAPVFVYCSAQVSDNARKRFDTALSIVPLPLDETGNVSLAALLTRLHDSEMTHVFVEPGPTLASSFFRESLADRIWVLRSQRQIDEETAPSARPVPSDYVVTGEIGLDGDCLTEYLNPSSSVYFGPYPSADFMRVAEAARR